jgi:hypothetical protein
MAAGIPAADFFGFENFNLSTSAGVSGEKSLLIPMPHRYRDGLGSQGLPLKDVA